MSNNMKHLPFIALFAAMAITVGCATTVSLPDRLDQFVEKTESECQNYTEEDWQRSRAEYEALVAEMKENYDSYTTAEKVRTMKAMGKYGSLVLNNEITSASETIGGVFEQIPETINGMIDAIDTAAIRKTVEDITSSIDTGAIRKTVDSIGKQIEGLAQKIDTARLREKIEAVIKIFGLE